MDNGFINMESIQTPVFSDKLEEFLDKVDQLCFEYGYEIHPTIEGWTGKLKENGEYDTIAIIGNGEAVKILHIDGDGRGK